MKALEIVHRSGALEPIPTKLWETWQPVLTASEQRLYLLLRKPELADELVLEETLTGLLGISKQELSRQLLKLHKHHLVTLSQELVDYCETKII